MPNYQIISALVFLWLLQGCGNNSGTDLQTLPNTQSPASQGYAGPPPATEDVQRFKLYVWDNLSANNRCGDCHGLAGQSPTFVQQDDINLAYQQANLIVNLTSPADSEMVAKVAGGHNCWLDSDIACADTLTRYIEAWSKEAVSNTKSVELKAPELRDPGQTKTYPEASDGFATNIHPLLTEHCAACHTQDGLFPQSPYFASADADVAYAEVKTKIDLDSPAQSRLVVRLRDEFHNCWSDCTTNAAEMLTAIQGFSEEIIPTGIDPALLTSKALGLTDGVLANSGGRYEENIIALFEFKTGTGTTAYDTSGIEPALNLTISGDVEWVGGWGLKINNGKAQATTIASRKLQELILATGEYSLEGWFAPANVTQEGPAVIASYSAGVNARNFTLGQTLYTYDFRQRMSTTNANGEAALTTSDDDEDAQATLQHVVITYQPAAGRKIYVNGLDTGDVDPVLPGLLNDWDNTYAFVVGNEVSNNRQWQGTLRLLAIHNRALTQDQIISNYDAGVGEKFYLLFSNEHLSGIPQGYVVFEVSQFDSYSYLFGKPFFVSLDAEAGTGSSGGNVSLEGMRIGINGHLAVAGQAYTNIRTELSAASYTEPGGQQLSSLGTIIAVEKGSEHDEFFLTFDRIGEYTNVTLDATLPAAPVNTSDQPKADIGIRHFEEIMASMAAITGVEKSHPRISQTFSTIKQQLPSDSALSSFVSAHQMAVTQLAIEFCNTLVDDATLRTNFFGSFNFTAPPAQAFTTQNRQTITDALYNKISGTNLSTQPSRDAISVEIDALISRLSTCGNNCASDRTATIVKASCAAVLGSAVVLVK